jgi:hypothetical protein
MEEKDQSAREMAMVLSEREFMDEEIGRLRNELSQSEKRVWGLGRTVEQLESQLESVHGSQDVVDDDRRRTEDQLLKMKRTVMEKDIRCTKLEHVCNHSFLA